jgi:hypothetical protein
MSRRPSLPGADELFRATGAVPAPVADDATRPAVRADPTSEANGAATRPAETPPERHAIPRRRARGGERRPTGRERHDEKITVYCSADELLDLERARLTLRGEFGIVVDRGRIVREALSIILEELESRGAQSPLVRRLHES